MPAKSKCVHCGTELYEWTRDCPKCGRPIANPDAPIVSDLRSGFKTGVNNRKMNIMPYIIGVIIIVIAAIIYFSRT